MRVLFDECSGERTPEAVMRGARFFHTVDLLALDERERTVAFDHPCPCVAGDTARSQCPLGSTPSRLPRLLRACLAALNGSRHPGRETSPPSAELLPGAFEPAASEAADSTAFDRSGDGVDMYVGRLRFAGPDAFSICWQVTGPRKEGAISNEYTRQLPPLASDDQTVAAPLS